MTFSTPGLSDVSPQLAEADPLSSSEISTIHPQGNFSASVILSEILGDQKIDKHIHEFNSLSKETDPELFFEALLNLGTRLESDGYVEIAAKVYSTIVGAGLRPARGQVLDLPLQHRAQKRLAALLGHGSFGEKLETMGRSLAKELLKPSVFLAMGAGSLAFRGMKFLAMRNLAELAPGILTRGFGLKALGNLAGFASEVPAFTLTGRWLEPTVGAHGRAPLPQEMASAALVLGSLKLFGAAFGQVGAGLALPEARLGGLWTHTAPASVVGRAPLQMALHQFGMLTGIMAGHGLEVLAGLRDRQGPEQFLGESLATLFHFNLMGTLTQRMLGTRFAKLERELDLKTKILSTPNSSPEADQPLAGEPRTPNFLFPTPNPELRTPNLILATANGLPADLLELLQPLQTSSNNGGHEGGARISPLDFLKYKLGSRATPEVLDYAQKIDALHPGFMELLAGTKIHDPSLLEISLSRLRHMVFYVQLGPARAGYVDWITHWALKDFMGRPHLKRLDRLLEHLHHGVEIGDYERFLAQHLPQWRLLPEEALRDSPEALLLAPLPLSYEAKRLLLRFNLPQRSGGEFSPITPRLRDAIHPLTRLLAHPEDIGTVEAAIRSAGASPLGYLRIARVIDLVAHEKDFGLRIKLKELSDPYLKIIGWPLTDLPQHSKEIVRSQFNAYFPDADMAEMLAQIHQDIYSIFNETTIAQRRQVRERKLDQFLDRRSSMGPLTREDIIQAFEALGDPHSLKIASAIRGRRFNFVVAPKPEFIRLGAAYLKDRNKVEGESWVAEMKSFYTAAREGGDPTGTMYLREIPLHTYTREHGRKRLFEVLTDVVHEYEHDEHIDPSEARTRGVILRQEILAYSTEGWWRALQGDPDPIRQAYTQGSTGIALYFRNFVEAEWYPHIDILSRQKK